MDDQQAVNPLLEAEEALFQRLLKRMIMEFGKGITLKAPFQAVNLTSSDGLTAANAAEYVQKHGTKALGMLDLFGHQEISGSVTLVAAQKIVESRRNKDEPVAQILFRVPEHLRDDVKRLALDEKRQMDELLTEAVLDLLLKYYRMPKAFQISPGS
ncbi:MAG: hypothetical protein ABF979_13790 [Gluconobacter sp.]|uniref:hypothetical protein n=1 Tax=Gluconobacter sp. TaxID=1876758 RepID=UPI0039ED85DA